MTAPTSSNPLATALTRDAGVEVPLIGGAMYPCSNPELVGAVSAAGGIGIVQPVSLTFVYRREYREGLRLVRRLAGGRPVGLNALIEGSSRAYRRRMEGWIDVALEEGVRFFVTSLGNPRWVVEKARAAGGIVYHDVTERRWAQKALDAGVHGFVAVNRDAGGHAGTRARAALLEELADLGRPVVCAGGIGAPEDFAAALAIGYAGVQIGTRLIATPECGCSDAYKRAIVAAGADDIVLTERVTGVPLAVIDTPYVRKVGVRAGPIARWMLRGRRRKHWMRSIYTIRSLFRLRRSSVTAGAPTEYWQAGKSVAGILAVRPVAEVVASFRAAALASSAPAEIGENRPPSGVPIDPRSA